MKPKRKNLYELRMNGKRLVKVDMEVPDWLPIEPKLNQKWLKGVITEALRHEFETNLEKYDKNQN